MKFLKRNIDYLTALAVVGMGAYSFATGDVVGGWVCLGIAVGLLVVLKLLYAVTERVQGYDAADYIDARESVLAEFEAKRLARRGLEPAPIPGESDRPPHKLGEDPNCGICRSLIERMGE